MSYLLVSIETRGALDITHSLGRRRKGQGVPKDEINPISNEDVD